MALDKSPPVGSGAQSVAKAANLSALLQAVTIGATPTETIEGLLLAAETAIAVQRTMGVLSWWTAYRLRRKLVKWGRGLTRQMRKDGSAEEMRKKYDETTAAYQEAKDKAEMNEQVVETRNSNLN